MPDAPSRDGIPIWRDIGATPLDDAPGDFDVVIVGGGPVGLTLALDLGQKGGRVLLLNKRDFVAAGSKAICFSKRTLDIWNRLGVAQEMVAKGVAWNVGKVFWGDSAEPVFTFDMLPLKHQAMPGFINLQQYRCEDILIDAVSQVPDVTIRWGHEVTGLRQVDGGVSLDVVSPDGHYAVDAPWVVACDGHNSPVRAMLGLDFDGRVFEDNFLIADIRLKQERPAERWFWFDPPFNPGRSALLHKQPDDIWRLDFQLGWNIDRERCMRPDYVEPLVRGMLGDDIEFEQEWYSVYTFQCRRMARFVHDRVMFAGDAAHLVSPFGARGCNGGVADADNLAWKLDRVIAGEAGHELLEAYNHEAIVTADENILNSSRSTDFLTPKSPVSHAFRDAVLQLARDHAWARPFVNSGRLSTAVAYPDSPLSQADQPGDCWQGIAPGHVAVDAPIDGGWLMQLLGGDFVLLAADKSVPPLPGVRMIVVDELGDRHGMIASRYDLEPGSAYLVRPDQYVAARWRHPTVEKMRSAYDRAAMLKVESQ
ncbi:FAD-dependent monooxygenase [Sphingobium tyrosinilyticum]|uniref:FAD-dependent monooxygenase n=1 Tax=Sphingobium tyrosinilyticum TaxID=2715436 RepID=A0ABV9EZM0_9SPHN